MTAPPSSPPEKPRRKQPKPVNPARLERIALHYLERFSAGTEGVRRVLLRRVERSARLHGTDREEAARWVEDVLAKLVRLELVDDRRYAEGKARSLFRRGDPPRLIRRTLASKGVDGETIDAALEEVLEHTEDPEWEAALAYCRRRRIGPFRATPEAREDNRQKDLGSLARRGFPSAVAYAVLDWEEE